MAKKITWLMLCLMLLVVGCTKSEEPTAEIGMGEVTASSLPISDREEVLPELGMTITGANFTHYEFEAGDKIRIVSEQGLDTILEAAEDGSEKIKFLGNFSPVAEVDTYYAVYPHTVEISRDGKVCVETKHQDGSAKQAAILAAMIRDGRKGDLHFSFHAINSLLQVGVVDSPYEYTQVRLVSSLSLIPAKYEVDLATNEVRVNPQDNLPEVDFRLAPDEEDSFFISLPPDHTFSELEIKLLTSSTELFTKSIFNFTPRLGYSYRTTFDIPFEPGIAHIFAKPDYEYIDCAAYPSYIEPEQVRFYITEELEQEFSAEELWTKADEPNHRAELDYPAEVAHRFSKLKPGTPYAIYAIGCYENDSQEMCYTKEKITATTLAYEGSLEIARLVVDPRQVEASIYTRGYDWKEVQVRAMLSKNPSLTDAQHVFEQSGKDLGVHETPDYNYYNWEEQDLTPETEYTLYATLLFNESHYQMVKQTFITDPMSIQAKLDYIEQNSMGCYAIHTGYSRIRFLFSQDKTLTDAEQVFSLGEAFNGTDEARSDGTFKVSHRFSEEVVESMEPGKSYAVYAVGEYKGQYNMSMVEVTKSGEAVRVTCGAQTSYSFYQWGSPIANKMYNVAIVMGDYFTFDGTPYEAFSRSSYQGISDQEIESAGIEVWEKGTCIKIRQELAFGDGSIGKGEAVLSYDQINLGEYYARTYIRLKTGDEIYSDEVELVVTGFPYDSEKGDYHGFYDDSLLNCVGQYTQEQTKFPWEDISNGASDLVNAFIFFRGHDHLHMEGGSRWPQALSSKFYVPEEGFKMYAWWHVSRSWNLREIDLAIDFSTEEGEDGPNIITVHTESSDELEATSPVCLMTAEYPCFQIEHQDAFRGPWSRVHRLILNYADRDAAVGSPVEE